MKNKVLDNKQYSKLFQVLSEFLFTLRRPGLRDIRHFSYNKRKTIHLSKHHKNTTLK